MKKLQHLAATAYLALAGLFTGASALAASAVVDVTGVQSIDLQGDAANTVRFINIGANAVVTSLDWAVTLNAFDPSLLSEMQVSFGSSSGLDLLTFAPGGNDAISGMQSYSGTLNLAGFGVAAGADGLLRVEFHEGFKDPILIGGPDGQWVSGSLTFGVSAVPEPASVVLLLAGLGLVAVRARRA